MIAWVSGEVSGPLYAAAWCVLVVFSCMTASRTAQAMGTDDPSPVVCDEVVGLLLPLGLVEPTWMQWCMAFVWFRVFDIIKPFPIGWLDRHVPGGIGIVLDDVVAGVFASIVCVWFTMPGVG